jgi:FkbM family methyltransferase
MAQAVSRVLRPTPLYPAARGAYRLLFDRPHLRELARKRAFYSPFVPRRGLAFDIGANRGNRTEVFLAMGARVVAVEPLPDAAACLREWFGHERGFTLEPCAVGAEPGVATLYMSDVDVISTMSPEWVQACHEQPHLRHAHWKPRSVRVTTLDALIERYGVPDFAKIDVEGFEVEVLRGLSRPIPALSFEYTPFRPAPALECLRLLRALGATRFNTSRGESLRLAHDRWLDYDAITAFCRDQVPLEPEFGDIYALT